MKTSSLSRREKLLLGLLSSTLIFSASFSYGAVNSSKVDAIMQTITNAGNAFTTQTDRDTYYQRVYTGLADAVALLITVQNNVGAMIGTAPVTVPPVGTLPPVNTVNPGQSAAQVLGIFADAPIPAPCPANTIMMKEDLGKPGAGMWLHKTWNNKNPSLGTYHVYKLTLKESAATYKEMLKLEPSPRVVFDSAETNGVVGGTNYTHIKISPYPCDFVTQAEIDAAKAQGYGWRGNFGACGHSNLDVTYKIDGVDDPKNTGSCTLKLGGTYYVNVGPSPSLSAASESGYRYTIMNRTSYTDPAGIYGIYPFVKDANGVSTNPQYDAWKEKTNSSGENAETLRQSVVNSYKSQIGSQATGGPGPVSNSAWASPTSVSCPTSLAGLQSANPSTISSTNSTGIQYTSVGGAFFNVKNYTNTNDTALPTSCTSGQKWIAKSGTNSCSVYSCSAGSSAPVAGTPGSNPGANNNPLIYRSVYGFAFGMSQGKLVSTDQTGVMVSEGAGLPSLYPWEPKLRKLYPECTAAQLAGAACTTENSMCWTTSVPDHSRNTPKISTYLACQKNPTIRNSCPTGEYKMAHDNIGGYDDDRAQMAWHMQGWNTVRYPGDNISKVWKWNPNTIVFANRDKTQPASTGDIARAGFDLLFFLEHAWTNESYVQKDMVSISECPGDFSQEIIDRGCAQGYTLRYSDGTETQQFADFRFKGEFLGSNVRQTQDLIHPTCTLDPYKTYYVNIKSPIAGQRNLKANVKGPNISDSENYYVTPSWLYNKEKAPYVRKPCLGWSCDKGTPFWDWYGKPEDGAIDYTGPQP